VPVSVGVVDSRAPKTLTANRERLNWRGLAPMAVNESRIILFFLCIKIKNKTLTASGISRYLAPMAVNESRIILFFFVKKNKK